MNCLKPFTRAGQAFGCGQCLPCRINKKRIWTHRIMLEMAQHKDNAFVTLTYNDDHVPMGHNLQPLHPQAFLKRLRRSYNNRIRYYLVGEYGDETQRPHYHLALFNYPTCRKGLTNKRRDGTCCTSCDLIQKLWEFGNIYIGTLEQSSASYIAGYVTKKLTNTKDPRLNGRNPEFARMSLRPGLGSFMMDEVASTLMEHNLDQLPDVPTALRHGNSIWPLGRYLTRQLRVKTGKQPNAPETTIAAQKEKMRPMYEMAEKTAPRGFKNFYFKTIIQETHQGKTIQIITRNKLKPKGHL